MRAGDLLRNRGTGELCTVVEVLDDSMKGYIRILYSDGQLLEWHEKTILSHHDHVVRYDECKSIPIHVSMVV